MSLQDQLSNFKQDLYTKIPDADANALESAVQDLQANSVGGDAPKVGDRLPDFELTNQNGSKTSLSELRKAGPVIIKFYRGGWCPYCNLELRAYQQLLPQFKSAGATLVAASPELPDSSMTTQEKNELEFEVLSDVNLDYARRLGIVFTLQDEIRPMYKKFGTDLESYNGAGQYDLPVPATFVIDQDGKVVFAHVDPDYTKRAEPGEVLKAVKGLADQSVRSN